MDGLQNFLILIEENWTFILVVIGIAIGIVKKTVDFFSKSKEERIAIAKEQLHETILKMITSAETDFSTWEKAGSIKRSQVIEEIYSKYPILSKVVNQSEVITWIDEEINNSLKTLREVVKINSEKE